MEYKEKPKYSTQGEFPSLSELNKLAELKGVELQPVRCENGYVMFYLFRNGNYIKHSKPYKDAYHGRIKVLSILKENKII